MITQYSHVWFGWFWDKSPSWFLKILKLPSFYSGNFQIFKNALGEFIPNRPLKHVITSTNQTTYFYAKLNLGWTGLNFLTRKTNLHRFKQFIISIVEQRDSTIYRVLLSTNTPHGAETNTLTLNLILSTIWCQPKNFPSLHLNATKTFQFWQARQNS